MLLRFGAANHRSIRDYQELLMSASKAIHRDGFAIPVPTVREAAVPVVAIYGANAAGKSNLIDAMGELRRHVVQSHVGLGATDPILRDPYRLGQVDGPTRLECTFTAPVQTRIVPGWEDPLAIWHGSRSAGSFSVPTLSTVGRSPA